MSAHPPTHAELEDLFRPPDPPAWAPARGRLARHADPDRVRACEERQGGAHRPDALACSCGWVR